MSRDQQKEETLRVAESVVNGIPDGSLIECKKFLDNLFKQRKLSKLYGTYIEGVEHSLANTGNGRMYVKYNIEGAVTGRLSNSGYNTSKNPDPTTKLGVSFHTLPRETDEYNIREYVIAEPGCDFITVDMKAMELRVLAHVANEKNMISAFKEGRDLHDYTTQMVFNTSKEKAGDKEWKKLRQISKEVSFLVVYGGNENTLANKRNISVKKAKAVIDDWMRTFPGVKTYMKEVRRFLEKHKYTETLFGRRRHLPNIASPVKRVSEESFRQGLNFTIQSPSSDILLCGLVGVDQEFNRLSMKSRVVATVHDSIEVISPKNETDKAVQIMHDQLVNCHYLKKNFDIHLDVPLEVEFEVGPSFGSGKKYELLSAH